MTLITNTKLTKIILDRRREWASHLKSGAYKQGRTWLVARSPRTDLEYCCLGVACTVFSADAGITAIPADYSPEHCTVGAFLGRDRSEHQTFMPSEMRTFLGLSHNSERLLAKLNDDNVPFATIAAVLPFLPVEDDVTEFERY